MQPNLLSRAVLPAVIGLSVIFGPAAFADTAVLGGIRDIDRGGYGGVIEYNTLEPDPAGGLSLGFGAALQSDSDGDRWVGVGVAAELGLGETFFVEGSFMPGHYRAGATRLGGSLHFRTTVGLGVNLDARNALSLGVSHLSNAGLDDYNPGTDLVTLRYLRRY